MTDFTPTDKPTSLLKRAAQSMIRSWINAGAGALATSGVLTHDLSIQFGAVGTALAIWGLNYIWALVEKAIDHNKLEAAIAAPAGKAAP